MSFAVGCKQRSARLRSARDEGKLMTSFARVGVSSYPLASGTSSLPESE